MRVTPSNDASACPHCRKPIANVEKLRGKKVQCSQCKGKYRIPAAAGAPPEAIFDLDQALKSRQPDPSTVPTREMPATPEERLDDPSKKVQALRVQVRRRPGRPRASTPPVGGGNRILGRPEIFAALLLIVAFFVPWYSTPFKSISGKDVAEVLSKIGAAFGVGEASVVSGLLYMIPVGGLVALVMIPVMPRRTPLGPFLGGGLALLGFGYFIVKSEGKAFNNASIGVWITLLALVALLLLPFIRIGSTPAPTAPPPPPPPPPPGAPRRSRFKR